MDEVDSWDSSSSGWFQDLWGSALSIGKDYLNNQVLNQQKDNQQKATPATTPTDWKSIALYAGLGLVAILAVAFALKKL